MISGASEEELTEAIGRADVLLEFMPKIKQLQKENKQLKDNWNKLKEYIEKDYGFYDKLIAPKYGCAMGALRRIKDKMQELEQGNDSNGNN